jgi:hypothetical protein
MVVTVVSFQQFSHDRGPRRPILVIRTPVEQKKVATNVSKNTIDNAKQLEPVEYDLILVPWSSRERFSCLKHEQQKRKQDSLQMMKEG